MITLTINNKEINLDKPVTVLEAARSAGIKIPTLCNHDAVKSFGGCRLCLVEIEKMPRLQTACTVMAGDGMVVNTESDDITRARQGVLEFLLIHHPLDCPYCDKAGECELQDVVAEYGSPKSRYHEEKRKIPEDNEDPILARNMERCIACTRCVRMCDDVQGAHAISTVGRGGHSTIEPFTSKFNCEYCGNCLTICPVGALLGKPYKHSYRPWQIDSETSTVCSYCGVGCTLNVQIRDEKIKRVIPKLGEGHNKGLLCSRGRFGYEYVGSPERLTVPLIRKEGKLVESSWDEALDLIAERLRSIKGSSGGASIAGIASPRCSNEDNYIFQKFMRISCGTNNIDSVSRTGYGAALQLIEDLLGEGVTANQIEDIKSSDTVLVVGGDPSWVTPILGLSVREASRRGANVVVVGSAKGLERFRTLQINTPVFKEADLLETLLTEVRSVKGIRGDRPGIDKVLDAISDTSPSSNDIAGYEDLKKMLIEGGSCSIIMGMDLVQRSDGYRSICSVAGLAYQLGAKLYLLSERNNEQGLIDMGCAPDRIPGGTFDDEGLRNVFETAWKDKMPEEAGLKVFDIIDSAKNKTIKALYVMGENPVFNLPGGGSIKEALESLDFLVVQDIFLTETGEIADVVLPALGWTEKEGTFTNLERRIQLQRKAVRSSKGTEDWRIIADLSGRMGYSMSYGSAKDIMAEIAKLSPLYKGLTYDEIGRGDTLWPYHSEPKEKEEREISWSAKEERGYDAELYLAVDRPLFHSGTLSRRSTALNNISHEPLLRIGTETAVKFGLGNGDRVSISTESGRSETTVLIDDSISDNRVFMSNNFAGSGVLGLMKYSIDKRTDAPGIEGCEVSIEKV